MKISKPVKLSSGRTIAHTRMTNNAQQATPTTGSEYMTPAKWREYCDIIHSKST